MAPPSGQLWGVAVFLDGEHCDIDDDVVNNVNNAMFLFVHCTVADLADAVPTPFQSASGTVFCWAWSQRPSSNTNSTHRQLQILPLNFSFSVFAARNFIWLLI